MSILAKLRVQERAGVARVREAIRTGVPLARGALRDARAVALRDSGGHTLAAQFTPLATWSDGSVRWLLVDACVDVAASAEMTCELHEAAPVGTGAALSVHAAADRIRVDTHAAIFEVPVAGQGSFADVLVGGVRKLGEGGIRLVATDASGAELAFKVARSSVQESGPLRAAVTCNGSLTRHGVAVAEVSLLLAFHRDSAALRIECDVWNPRPALHVGGLWDLGDAGSVLLDDLSIELRPATTATSIEWQSTPGAWTAAASSGWMLYQDSSGGEHWDSPNHVDARGRRTVSFRGFRVEDDAAGLLATGQRASAAVRVSGSDGCILAGVEKFWQNFPKALRWRDGTLGIGLFPGECAAGFELQGGEKKRHAVMIDFANESGDRTVHALHVPLEVTLDPDESAATRAVGHLTPAARDGNTGYCAYVASMLEGPHSVGAKRELIDEFGWRNFGDLYADHEAVHHKGAEPFISHYNNQYDFVYGASMQFLRTGEHRWRELMADAARHLIDIDIYRTGADKAGFSGGMFWHTDHYQPAATCTHRTYSRKNAVGSYGGGPSNEHNYTSGLLHYFYLTGDRQAVDTIRTLADWVIAMDDGSRTLLGLIDEGRTGSASKSRDADFHKPGRGAGNSINALLDAYTVTRDRRYMAFAEELIERVIHPHDEVATLGLEEPETRWSYVVFLQVLGKYLDRKLEWGETDYRFWYARASLLTYARWMLVHEKPYKDVLHKVELPTETWPAHDVRKCHVFHVAARYAVDAERADFTRNADFYFERCLADLLSFPTAHVTRPQVILCTYGVVHGYYQNNPAPAPIGAAPDFDFGAPVPFATQGARLRATLRTKLGVAAAEVRRLLGDRWRRLLGRFKS